MCETVAEEVCKLKQVEVHVWSCMCVYVCVCGGGGGNSPPSISQHSFKLYDFWAIF